MTSAYTIWKATRWFFNMTSIIIALTWLTSCEEENNAGDTCCNETPIHHIAFSEPKTVFYNHPVSLDLNEDGKDDFAFTVSLFMNGPSVDQLYAAVSLHDSRIKLINTEAAAYEEDITVGDISVSDPANWSIDSGELMTLTVEEDLSEQWSGPWISQPDSHLAVSIRVNNEYYYGWIRLQANTSEESLLVLEYAIQTNAGKTIQTGQTE